MGKFKIGDLVRFVDEPIEGHITSFQKDDLIGVTDDTGFEIPVLASKLTLVHGNMRREDDDLEASTPHIPLKFIDKGILLAISGEHKEGLARLHIINETSYELLISISEITGNKTKGIYADKVSSNDSVQFYSANFATVGKWPTFRIQILRHSSSTQVFCNPINREQRVRPVDLTNQKISNEILGERIWFYELDKEDQDIGIEKLKSHFVPHRPK